MKHPSNQCNYIKELFQISRVISKAPLMICKSSAVLLIEQLVSLRSKVYIKSAWCMGYPIYPYSSYKLRTIWEWLMKFLISWQFVFCSEVFNLGSCMLYGWLLAFIKLQIKLCFMKNHLLLFKATNQIMFYEELFAFIKSTKPIWFSWWFMSSINCMFSLIAYT